MKQTCFGWFDDGKLFYRSKTTENQMRNEIKNVSDFELISSDKENILSSAMLTMKCSCGRHVKMKYSKFQDILGKERAERKCDYCLNKKNDNKSVDEWLRENSEGTIRMSDYINSTTKMKLRCACGKEFLRSFSMLKTKDFLTDQKFTTCKSCRIKKSKYIFDEYDCECLTDYSNIDEIISVRCSCDKIYHTTLRRFRNGQHCCDDCSGRISWVPEKKLEFISKNNCEYISGDLERYNSELTFRCSCGEIFTKTFYLFHSTPRCDNCRISSKGEERISEWLKNKNINFEREKTFDGCVDKNRLRFDFYLPNYNILIEFDGEQHFKSIEMFGGLKNLRDTQKKDKIKNKWAYHKGIDLIRIKYNEYDSIEKILDKELGK